MSKQDDKPVNGGLAERNTGFARLRSRLRLLYHSQSPVAQGGTTPSPTSSQRAR